MGKVGDGSQPLYTVKTRAPIFKLLVHLFVRQDVIIEQQLFYLHSQKKKTYQSFDVCSTRLKKYKVHVALEMTLLFYVALFCSSLRRTQTQHVRECLKYFESDASLNLTPDYKGAGILLSWNLDVFADPGVSGTLCQMLLKATAPAYFRLNNAGLC